MQAEVFLTAAGVVGTDNLMCNGIFMGRLGIPFRMLVSRDIALAPVRYVIGFIKTLNHDVLLWFFSYFSSVNGYKPSHP